MISRVISMLLIATVVGCPLRCGNPLLGLLSASDADSASIQAVTTQTTSQSCCSHCGPQQQESSSPAPVSDDSACQCFCGGAILADHVVLNDPAETLDFSAIVCELNSTVSTSQPEVDPSVAGPTGSENQGRLLRTLRMSFLC